MREKTLRTVVAFHTTAEAMATEKLCRALGLEGRLISAPRALGADCGIAWSAPPTLRAQLEQALREAAIETAAICELPL